MTGSSCINYGQQGDENANTINNWTKGHKTCSKKIMPPKKKNLTVSVISSIECIVVTSI